MAKHFFHISEAVAKDQTETTFPTHKWKIVDQSITIPGAPAIVDDQGNTDLCTSHALAKVVVDGLDQGKWTNGEEFDVKQAKIAEGSHSHKGRAVEISASGKLIDFNYDIC